MVHWSSRKKRKKAKPAGGNSKNIQPAYELEEVPAGTSSAFMHYFSSLPYAQPNRTMATLEEELQTVAIENPFQRAYLNILFTANYLSNLQREVLSPYGITGTQYNVLRILRGQQDKCLATYSIKSRMLERNSDASRVVDRLEKQGLVMRRGCPNDKRSTMVHITEAGLSLLAEIDPVLQKHQPLGSLSPEEAQSLASMLDKSRG